MAFRCPWGCTTEEVEHDNAWECPMYAQKFLGALQSMAQKSEDSVH